MYLIICIFAFSGIFFEHSACETGEGNGYPLQYSCLENSTDRGAWWATVHGVAKSDATERQREIYIYIYIYSIYVHPSPRSTLEHVYHLEKVPDTL